MFVYPVVDSWGKLPSALLSGNFYDFGGFSECFHITRNNSGYQTQYCLGDLMLEFNGMPKEQKVSQWNVPYAFLSENNGQINPRGFLPK